MPKELRTSFVSMMSYQGVPVEEIARLAGHASSRTTEVIYRRELRPVITTGAEVMDQIFPAEAEPRSCRRAIAFSTHLDLVSVPAVPTLRREANRGSSPARAALRLLSQTVAALTRRASSRWCGLPAGFGQGNGRPDPGILRLVPDRANVVCSCALGLSTL